MKHQPKLEYKDPRDSRYQWQIREAKNEARKQDIIKGKASLAGQVSPARGEDTARSKQPRHPGMVCRGSRGQNHPTNHSSTTHVVNQCDLKPQDD